MKKLFTIFFAILLLAVDVSAQSVFYTSGRINNTSGKKILVTLTYDDGINPIIDTVRTGTSGYYYNTRAIQTTANLVSVTAMIKGCNANTISTDTTYSVQSTDSIVAIFDLYYCSTATVIDDTLTIRGKIDSLYGEITRVSILTNNKIGGTTTDSDGYYEYKSEYYNSAPFVSGIISIEDCNGNQIIDSFTHQVKNNVYDEVVVNFVSCPKNKPKYCKAQFTAKQASDINGPIPNSLVIYENSKGNNLNYKWHFGDGDSSSLKSPSHTYSGNGPYNLCLTISNVNCTDTYCDTISIDNNGMMNKKDGFSIVIVNGDMPISTKTIENDIQLNIYPNPSHNNINLSFNSYTNGNAQLIIYDISGRIVKQINTATLAGTNKINVETSELAKGIYNLQLKTDNWTATSIFIKK